MVEKESAQEVCEILGRRSGEISTLTYKGKERLGGKGHLRCIKKMVLAPSTVIRTPFVLLWRMLLSSSQAFKLALR